MCQTSMTHCNFVSTWTIVGLFDNFFLPFADMSNMNNNTSSSIVSVLKQKMADTREEASKIKEKIQDLENSVQVIIIILH